jgi:quercetin dioxygenase-like cupin family protein
VVSTPRPIPFEEIPGSKRARKFEGKHYGSTASFFLSRHAPGEGPDLHRHPYEETFICQGGTCTFTLGDDTITVGPGHIVIVPPNTPHKFVNDGDTRLQQVSIHPAPEMAQEDVPPTG